MAQKILITGGAGYIGSILCRKLLEYTDNEVIVFDNFMYGVEPVLPLVSYKRFKMIEGDIRSDKIRVPVSEADIVIHLAAIVGFPACMANPANAMGTNVDGTKNVIRYMSGSQRLIFASTGSIYGKVEGLCSEDSRINPISLYGVTKYEAEQAVMERENSLALRFSTVFGVSPRMRMDLLVNDLVFQALRFQAIAIFERGARRSFLHCDDTAQSYLFALEHFEEMKGNVYNVGNRSLNLSKHDVVMAIKKFLNFYLLEDPNRSDPDERDYEVDFSKIMALGYRPELSLEDGVEELLKLYSVSSFYRHFRNS